MPSTRFPRARSPQALVAAAWLLASAASPAQTPPPLPPGAAASAPVAAPAPTPPAPQAPAAPSANAPSRVEITGGRDSDTEARRRASAAKIVVGREEIDKFGDATVGEVLRRLPGVTTPGAPGRGGPPRLRGLGSGFTQILIDGQRIAPGFNLDSLSPDQVERIEILRAPTAETGARAIAGTINIITREGFRIRLNDLRVGLGTEGGLPRGGINWSHNDTAGPLTYTLGANVFQFRSKDENSTTTTVEGIDDGSLLEARQTQTNTRNERFGANLNARLQWRLNDLGDSLVLMPSVFHSENTSRSETTLQRLPPLPPRSGSPELFDSADSTSGGQFTNARLGAMWRQRVGDVRMELNGNVGGFVSRNSTLRQEFGGLDLDPARVETFDDRTEVRERSANVSIKGSLLAGGQEVARPGGAGGAGVPRTTPEHALVFGAEVEAVSRDETRVSVPDLAEFGDKLSASTLRVAAFVQDEWNPTPRWGANVGLRWEGLTTRGDTGQGTRPENTSSVWTPLINAVYRPDPKSRDQVRVALTRSYRSPPTSALIARPAINREKPVVVGDEENTLDFPDSAGNPDLKPELATGIDLAFERYLEGGGVLSANLFHRRISNLIRSTTQLEPVSWSRSKRYVRRQRNIGNASTSGLELEARFRLDQLVAGAPRLELRTNAALFRSRVEGVPGPDNRLEQQPRGTLNVGADYRFRGTPFTAGGNVNLVPETSTRLDESQARTDSRKRVWDLYALWTFNPALGLRLLANNLAPRDSSTLDVIDSAGERTRRFSTGPSETTWQLRLEMKL
jgi:iron complex outermembrane receptor protein